jgi:hypothetical protein
MFVVLIHKRETAIHMNYKGLKMLRKILGHTRNEGQ